MVPVVLIEASRALTRAFEEAFDVEIPDEKAETILTVGDAISHLEAK